MAGGHTKIISIGAAVQDVFLQGDVFKAQKEGDHWVEEFNLGAKYDLENITFATGGGATNGAVTFARHGLDSYFMGKIAHDPAGQAVLEDLKKEGVKYDGVAYSKKYATGYSALLLSPRGERTILTYRGASTHYRMENFNFNKIESDWLFITSLAGSMDILEALVRHAKHNHIKVALIPGKGELSDANRLRDLIVGVDIISANKEEMQTLVEGDDTNNLAVNASRLTDGIAVVTDGPNGVSACDGQKVSWAGMYEDVPVIDRTGAGDAFASGFTAKIAAGGSLEDAILFASANSTSVVSHIGAKTGILHANSELHDMQIETHHLQ